MSAAMNPNTNNVHNENYISTLHDSSRSIFAHITLPVAGYNMHG